MGRNRDPYHRYCQSDSCIDMFGQSDEYGGGMWWCFVTNSTKLRTWFVNLYLLVQFTHIDDKKQGFLRCFDVRAHTHWILNFIQDFPAWFRLFIWFWSREPSTDPRDEEQGRLIICPSSQVMDTCTTWDVEQMTLAVEGFDTNTLPTRGSSVEDSCRNQDRPWQGKLVTLTFTCAAARKTSQTLAANAKGSHFGCLLFT